MKNNDRQIVKQAEEKVTGIYESVPHENLLYHSLEHTRKVAARANEIAAHYELTDKDIIVLNVAAWFHDIGHLFSAPADHEQKSVEMMKEWMADKGEYSDSATEIEQTILATKLSTEPRSLVQEIIKDADTYHFGTPQFKKNDKLLRKEMALRKMDSNTMDWRKNTLMLLEAHKFYTSYCKELLDKEKRANIENMKRKIEEKSQLNTSDVILPEEDKKDKRKDNIPKQSGFMTKGIQTMLRLTSENHMRLSEMADNKANILISVNAIIISLILSVLIRKIEVDKYLAIPTMVFLASSLVTIVISILATRPKITGGKFTREDIVNRKTNLLFFGNFFKSELEEYRWGMSTMMRDHNYLYGVLIDDIYYLGKVLGRKYRLVRLAYGVFMVGIIVSAFAFIIAFMFNPSAPATTIIEGSGSPF